MKQLDADLKKKKQCPDIIFGDVRKLIELGLGFGFGHPAFLRQPTFRTSQKVDNNPQMTTCVTYNKLSY